MRKSASAVESARAPSLAELQRWLSNKIAGASSSTKTRSAKKSRISEDRDCAHSITRAKPLPPARRIEIYAFAYQQRLYEALAQDFALTRARVGKRAFSRLVREYFATKRPKEWSVSFVGRGLPAFLRRHGIMREVPELADLARLEWLKIVSFFAADAQPWDSSCLAGMSPARVGRARLRLAPSTFLARYKKSLVYREGSGAQRYRVRVAELNRDEWAFLLAVERGKPLARCVAAIRDPQAPVGDWLKRWAEGGVIELAPR